ncbi:MAG: hypothetical protein PF445_10270 [Melioribacteraceae bacterium]|jgi:hypothetical protein|nr:hypothetical protein [Melioribacteraceae bacterium]
MKNLTDENLNKLIDNELSSSEIDELYNLIKKDEKLLSKTKAHQMVDSVLKTLEIENAPANTTDLIMQKITNSVLAKEKKNGFFKFMMGAFAASILLVIGFIISSNSVSVTYSESTFSSIREQALEYLQNFTFPINSDLLLVITSALTVIILISGYFVFEEHKSFKQKLDSIL